MEPLEIVASKPMGALNIRLGPTSFENWLGYACIAILLLAATFQAAHICGSQLPDSRHAAQFQSGSPNTPVCLICLLAESTKAVLISISCFLTLWTSVHVCFPQSQPRAFLQSFPLYVRPPPAY